MGESYQRQYRQCGNDSCQRCFWQRRGMGSPYARSVIGDEVFFRILRSYASDLAFQYGTVVTDEFQEVAEREYGTSLSWFFDQWVYNEGRPH